MAQLFQAAPANRLPAVPDYNICPTDPVHVVRASGARRALVAMRWGFVPSWYKAPTDGPLLINARAETLAEKPAFAAAARARRCLVPVSGYYEWARAGEAKLPWYYKRADGAPLALAGIWQDWQAEEGPMASCALVTTAANRFAGQVHHRMPVIIEPQAWGLWLGEEGRGAARLMGPAGETVLTAHRVSPKVNSNRAEGAELIAPYEPDESA
jgi:putative SOS response-associated peptidase YedK